MRLRCFLAALFIAGLAACSNSGPAPRQASAPPPPQPQSQPDRVIVGGDRDAHGCIPSAGYSWCAQTQRCERPWELASQQGFGNTREAFDRFCKNKP